MTTFVLATANPDKATEIQAVLADVGAPVTLRPRDPSLPEVEETGLTLEDNARLKAIDVCGQTGLPAIADDTGLEVDALDGAPGVRSARFAGEHATYADNVNLLLERLHDVPEDRRTARFSTVAIARWPDGREVAALGTVEGVIATAPRGDNGFGYDPVFMPIEGDGRTFAEMDPAEKHACSHRGRAFRTLAEGLRADSESI
ncbi:MAG: RdgB/HAM1 family non-canonical purine NTP pyrophosphatase [Acidimicrobiia bacterium]|nr:RdgB/HAM1 family non-canonical purine NTP pyrophosphatase [Acidimicrobiia bacterium]